MQTTSPSRHKCLIYEGSPSEQLPVVVPFLMGGLKEGRRCLYLGDPKAVAMLEDALSARGVDTAAERRRGALVYSSDRGHLEGGAFDPRAMVAMLREVVAAALRDGFAGLCATGDMAWELGSERNFERLLEYEALLEAAFRELPLTGVCQYRRDAVPPRALGDALLAHRSLLVGRGPEAENLFYIPPELLLADGDEAARDRRGEWLCGQIQRVQRAESRRDAALEALEEAKRDLERRVAERTAALEEANKELEAFSYSVSHDLRAPLRHIRGFIGLLREEAAPRLSEADRGNLERIEAAAERMGALIEALLALSRASRAELRLQRVPLAALVKDAVEELAPEAAGRRVTWRLGSLPEVRGDPALLRQALANLLGNALKFTRPRAEAVVEVSAEELPGRVVVSVRDNGVGFDAAQAGRLFGVFQRLHGPAEFEGTGVGLANVRRIARRHGGDAWAEGEAGKGAAFHLSLPEREDAGPGED